MHGVACVRRHGRACTCAAPGVSGTARLTTDTWTHGGSATCSSSRARGRSAAERMSTTGSCASIIWLSRRSSETMRSARVCCEEIVISSRISDTQAYASSRELERTTERPMPLRLAASVNCATSAASASCGPSVEMVSVRVRSCSEICSHSRGAPLTPPPPLISTASPTCRREGRRGGEAGARRVWRGRGGGGGACTCTCMLRHGTHAL